MSCNPLMADGKKAYTMGPDIDPFKQVCTRYYNDNPNVEVNYPPPDCNSLTKYGDHEKPVIKDNKSRRPNKA